MVSSSVLILIIIALRKVLKGKMNLCFQYALWGLVLVRLLMPFSIGSSGFSILNFLPESLIKEEGDFFETEVIQGTPFGLFSSGNTGDKVTDGQDVPVSSNQNNYADNGNAAWQLQVGNAISGYSEIDANADSGAISNADTSTGIDAGLNTGRYQGEVQDMKTSLNLTELWKIVWLIGMMLVGGVLFTANGMFAWKLKKTRRRVDFLDDRQGDCNPAQQCSAAQQSSAALELAVSRKVYCTGAVETPCLFGLFRPAIYLTPSAMEQEKSLWHILEHEMTHYRHRDHIWAMLRGVCLAVHWYNPLVWWAAALSRADAELACDAATIRRLGEQERAAYGRTLLNMTCSKRGGFLIAATTMTGSKNRIKERIALLVKKPKMAVYTLAAVLVLVLAAVGCTFTGNEDGTETVGTLLPEETQKPTNEPTQEPAKEPTAGASAVLPSLTIAPTEAVLETPTPVPAEVSPSDAPIVTGEAGISPTAVPTVEEIVISPTVKPAVTEAAKVTPSAEVAVLWENREVKDGLYFAVLPTFYSNSGDDYRYVYYGEQEKAKAAYEEAMKHVEEGRGFREREESSGIYVMYQDAWWLFTRDGAMMGRGRVEAEHAKELFDICKEAAAAVHLPEPVRPETIKGIISATLYYDEVVTITEKEKLALLEQWLSESEELFGGAACWFTAILSLELENGKQVNLSMATDSCGTWMSEGAFYQYANGNEELFGMFAEQAEQERRKQRLEFRFLKSGNFNWQQLIAGYGEEEALLLLEDLRGLVQRNTLTETQMTGLLKSTKGLDGAYAEGFADILRIAYQNNEPMFAYCWSQMPESEKKEIVAYLAYTKNLSEEEVKKSLEENLKKFSEKPQEQGLDISERLEAAENTYADLQQKLKTDISLTQGEMNTLAGECAVLWEEEMDAFWYMLEPLLTAEEAGKLHEEQQEWLTMRDSQVQKLIDAYDGGSLTGLVVGQKKAELTRERVYELVFQLIKRRTEMEQAEIRDYSGCYVNTMGTDEVFDELKLKLLEDGSYQTEISLYRLTTLEGRAVLYGDMLVFSDPVVGVKGNIRLLENVLIFTVTESYFEYLTPGEGFEFVKSE